MHSTLRSAAGSLLLASLLACAGDTDGPPGPQRTDSVGVEIVTNPGSDRPLEWSLREEVRIGGADEGTHLWTAGREGEGPGEFRFPLSVWTEPDGSVTVLDPGRRALIRYSAAGEFLDEEHKEGNVFGSAAGASTCG